MKSDRLRFCSLLFLLSVTGLLFADNPGKLSTRITPVLAYHWNTHLTQKSAVIVNVLDTKVLNWLEQNGFSLSETLGGRSGLNSTQQLYLSNSYYRDFANSVGKPIPHNKKTDQLPRVIPPSSGDIPEMVRLIRNFEDKGKRSRRDRKGGYRITQLSNNSHHPYSVEYDGDEPRHFDYRWLNSRFGYIKLIAVVNRIDRKDFDQSGCGEVRYIYRLSYRSKLSRSSMPFFLNVVHQYPKQKTCSAFARHWLIQSAFAKQLRALGDKAPEHFARFLLAGALKKLKFKQLENNFQSLRFTSGYMHDFGGQAMYFQRIFKVKNSRLVAVPLENTPDVQAVEKNPKLFLRFVEFLKQKNNLQKLDQGTLVIDFDKKFLARRSVSWSTLGRGRTANKPYRRLFSKNKKALKSIDISGLKYIKSHRALVERLDNMTCMGCHQSSGTAGFHMLGLADGKYSHDFNIQELPYSAHAYAESIRRKAYIQKLAQGQKGNSFRPHSNFPAAKWNSSGNFPVFEKLPLRSLCALSQKDFLATPMCGAHKGMATVCKQTVNTRGKADLFGECALKQPKSNRQLYAGGACWTGTITEVSTLPKDRGAIPTFNYFAFQDKWKLSGPLHRVDRSKNKQPRYSCVLPQSGAPLGRRSRKCTLAEENFSVLDHLILLSKKKQSRQTGSVAGLLKGNIPDELCANQGGNGFDLCAASGDSGKCLQTRVVRAMLDACYPGNFCREDYICQRLPNYHNIAKRDYLRKRRGKRVNVSSPEKIQGKTINILHKQNIGFCVPTYFLFNMRVDGHPSPATGLSPGKPKFDRTKPLRGYKK